MTTAEVESVVASLEQELAQLLPTVDLPHGWSRSQVAEHEATRVRLTRRLMTIRDSVTTIAERDGQIHALTSWKNHLDQWRQALGDEYLALPSRIRDAHTLGVKRNLEVSIITVLRGLPPDCKYSLTTLRLGALMRDAGYQPRDADPSRNYHGEMPWVGSLKEVEQWLQELATSKAMAETALAEALLDDATRERLTAEAMVRRDALNALPQRKTRGDGSQYKTNTLTGDELEVL